MRTRRPRKILYLSPGSVLLEKLEAYSKEHVRIKSDDDGRLSRLNMAALQLIEMALDAQSCLPTDSGDR